MKDPLQIALVQTTLHWEDRKKNRDHFEKLIHPLEEVDLILLPEMFTTGFSMQTHELAETMQGETVQWMKMVAKHKNCAIAGSIIIEENKKFYNRFIWCDASGAVFTYDKRHLFRMANENAHYSGGSSTIIIPYKGWKIQPLICYDLRFPVWSRNIRNNYDLLLYVANWPEARRQPWMKLLQARAIENQCYVAGVNRIGMDGRTIDHSGDSMIIDFKGEVMELALKEEKIIYSSISLKDLNDFREKFPVSMDADEFEVM